MARRTALLIILAAGLLAGALAGGGPAGAHRDEPDGTLVVTTVVLESVDVRVSADASRYTGDLVLLLRADMEGHDDSAEAHVVRERFKIDHPVGKPFVGGTDTVDT